MATPESHREPTLTDVMHAITLLADEVASLRRITLDEFAAVRHRFDAIDRDIQGITNFVVGLGGEEA